ncbi:hypothetical protein B7494_g602 [Chlorociboria aeruginascens]|nr:hypothetical protein B7494_g602 [Chlorociboria aeruginascens]
MLDLHRTTTPRKTKMSPGTDEDSPILVIKPLLLIGQAIQFCLNDPFPELKDVPPSSHDYPLTVPSLILIFEQDETKDIGPAAALLSAYSIDPNVNWLVMTCCYPLLPPTALQQLLLEFQDPFTCFINEDGFVQPLIGISGSEALRMLKENLGKSRCELIDVVKEIGGKNDESTEGGVDRMGEYKGRMDRDDGNFYERGRVDSNHINASFYELGILIPRKATELLKVCWNSRGTRAKGIVYAVAMDEVKLLVFDPTSQQKRTVGSFAQSFKAKSPFQIGRKFYNKASPS